MNECPGCNANIVEWFRFCPSCGRALRTKLVEYFRGDQRLDDGDLRVSVYLAEPQHVRLSVWRNATAEAALSLDPAEAGRLGRFLQTVVKPRRRSIPWLLRQLAENLFPHRGEASWIESKHDDRTANLL